MASTDVRITSVSTELANQLTELSRDIDELNRRSVESGTEAADDATASVDIDTAETRGPTRRTPRRRDRRRPRHHRETRRRAGPLRDPVPRRPGRTRRTTPAAERLLRPKRHVRPGTEWGRHRVTVRVGWRGSRQRQRSDRGLRRSSPDTTRGHLRQVPRPLRRTTRRPGSTVRRDPQTMLNPGRPRSDRSATGPGRSPSARSARAISSPRSPRKPGNNRASA